MTLSLIHTRNHLIHQVSATPVFPSNQAERKESLLTQISIILIVIPNIIATHYHHSPYHVPPRLAMSNTFHG